MTIPPKSLIRTMEPKSWAVNTQKARLSGKFRSLAKRTAWRIRVFGENLGHRDTSGDFVRLLSKKITEEIRSNAGAQHESRARHAFERYSCMFVY